MSARRVVVTGIGAVSPLGSTAASTWEGVVAGRSGVGPITLFDAAGFAVRIAAEVSGFDPEVVFGRRRARHLDRVTQLALVATAEAIESSKLDVGADPHRVGVVFGTGIGGIRSLEEGMAVLNKRGPEWVSPYTLPMMIPNMVVGQVAMEWGIRGYSSCTVTACSASAQADRRGARPHPGRAGGRDGVRRGRGRRSRGSASPGFAAMKALSTRNDEPDRASRPFDAGRDGFVMGEGAAALVLEEREAARRPGGADPGRAGRLRRHVRRLPHDPAAPRG